MINSADAEQKPTDLDLHCLQRQAYLGSAGSGLKLCLIFFVVIVDVFIYLFIYFC